MSDFNRGIAQPTPVVTDMSVDAGLRSFMLGVYNKMALGLLLSAALAFATVYVKPVADLLYVISPDGRLEGFTILGLVIRFAPIVIMLGSVFVMRNPSPASSGILYWLIVSTIGAGLGLWLLAYTTTSVITTFLVSASAFGVLSIVGYTTKRDLNGLGNFAIMGVFGLLAAMLVNMFLHSAMIDFVISVVGVLAFSALTAYDTQKLKGTYYRLGGNTSGLAVATNYGALSLYLDFINLFLFLLRIFGGRR
jgi:uncharacterized protein